MSRSVIHSFLESAEKYPDRIALWARGRDHTYAELSAIAESARQTLEDLGLDGSPRIGVMTGDGTPTYAAILAILANGSAYVPLNIKNPVARNLAIIEEADIRALVYEVPSELTDRIAAELGERCRLVQFSGSTTSGSPFLQVRWEARPEQAYLFFTSGSTGKPKGVPISHENLNNFMEIMGEEGIYDFRPEDRFLQMFELTFDLSVMSLFVPLAVGAGCYVVPDSRIGAAAALKVMQEHDISVALMVPSVLVYLEPYLPRLQLPALRWSLFCGEALPDSLAQKWHQVAGTARIENVYGPTEATIFCLRYSWDPVLSPPAAVNGIVPIGKPMTGTGAYLLDEAGDISGERGRKGQLLLTGRQLSPEYWRDPAKTSSAFMTIHAASAPVRAYRTGDLCSIDQNGDFIYHGRIDTQVKIDGHRVELGEIEHHLRDALGRTSLAVVAVAEGGRQVLALFLEEPQVDADRLFDMLKARLPEYMIPRRIRYIPSLPLNLNGKVDRPRLLQLMSEA